MNMTIQEGYGYWDCTQDPIGMCFRRAGQGGLEVVNTSKLDRKYKGCDTEGQTKDGRRVAFDSAHAIA